MTGKISFPEKILLVFLDVFAIVDLKSITQERISTNPKRLAWKIVRFLMSLQLLLTMIAFPFIIRTRNFTKISLFCSILIDAFGHWIYFYLICINRAGFNAISKFL